MRAAGWNLVREALRPAAATTVAVALVSLLLAVGQALAAAAVAPGPAGAARLAVALLPAVLGIALPIGLLFGLVAASRGWREGGDWLGLAASGLGARHVVPAVLLLGLCAGGLAGGLSHLLEPLGRAEARGVLARAAGDLRLVPARPLVVGDTLVLAQGVDGPRLGDVLLAREDTAVAARRGELGGGGVVRLEDGEAVAVGAAGEGSWRLAFERAELRLDVQAPRRELAERTGGELREAIARQAAAGESAVPQRLALAKRTALPACLPVLALLALPLGARGARPGVAATATALGWWTVLRLSDQAAGVLDPALAAWCPTLALALAAVVAWAGWGER